MRKWRLCALLAMWLVATLVACDVGTPPDWTALYSERLGQTVMELDESTLGQEYLDPASGALTRTAWARLQDGSMVLLGLPPHGLDTREVVERTVVLSQQEWQDACRQALGEEEIWGWEMNHAHPGNSIPIHINNQRDAYCEFFFLPEGWELRTVQSHGILKPFHQPSSSRSFNPRALTQRNAGEAPSLQQHGLGRGSLDLSWELA